MKLEHILTILITICLGLASFSLKWTFDANAELKVMRERLDQIASDKARDDNQDRQIKMFWKYHSYMLGKLNESRFKDGLPPAEPPKLD